MKISRWKPRSMLPLSLAILYICAGLVNGVSLTGCSSQNTGASSTSSHYMTNGLCHDTCQGYAFAITQFTECWCSNEAPADTTGTDSCNKECPGYPSELCGNQQGGLYGYIALGKAPESTAGVVGSNPGSFASGVFGGSSNEGGGRQFQTQATVVQTSVFVNTQPALSSSYSAPPTRDPVTVVQISTTAATSTIVQTASSSSSNPPSSSSSNPPSSSSSNPPTTQVESVTATVTSEPRVVTSASVITKSGVVITSYVTSLAAVTAAASATATLQPENSIPKETRGGLSDGAVAGITIGALAAAALLGALLFFLCWRPRRRERDSENGMKRSSSILSRTGLLRTPTDAGSVTPLSVPAAAAGGRILPRIRTTGIAPGSGHGPESAATMASSEMSDNRRHSRPLFVDDRLNPNALMQQVNASRVSVGTLQDNQDYSRPLEVRNPDHH